MTNTVIEFLKKAKQKIGQPQSILEIGSLNVNGTARSVFQMPNTEYIGIDMTPGKDVDIVIDAHEMFSNPNIIPEKFDAVICCETLEHDLYFWITLDNMKKALKKNGWLIITTPGSEVIKHNYPSDYFRYFGDTYKKLFFKDMADVFIEEYWRPYNRLKDLRPDEIHGYGRKI